MENIFETLNFLGLGIGITTFLIIGLFHPIVVKAEYYFGVKCWWCFLILGIITLVCSLLVNEIFCSTALGIFAFSSFWSIIEVFHQKRRVEKGWFPANPKRKYNFDKNHTCDCSHHKRPEVKNNCEEPNGGKSPSATADVEKVANCGQTASQDPKNQ